MTPLKSIKLKIQKLTLDELRLKVIRCFVVVISYLCIANVLGMQVREAHQFFLYLAVFVVFGILLDNIWLTLFMWWTAFLYILFRFQTGHVYLINILLGCILYYLVKVSFKKEHIDFFIKAVLWLAFINVAYMAVQAAGYDFIFTCSAERPNNVVYLFPNTRPIGFMGNPSYTGIFLAMCVPLLFTRPSKLAKTGAILLFYPLWVVKCFLAFVAAIVGLIFVLFFVMPKKVWIIGVIVCLIVGGLFLVFVDRPGTERLSVWSLALSDMKIHPVTGWGLDSWRTYTEKKNFVYIKDPIWDAVKEKWHGGLWDNPHNLIVSLIMEFGVVSLFLLGGYLRQCAIWFERAVKSPNTLALAGFGVVVLLVSMGHFPLYLARLCVLIIPVFALFEIQCR